MEMIQKVRMSNGAKEEKRRIKVNDEIDCRKQKKTERERYPDSSVARALSRESE